MTPAQLGRVSDMIAAHGRRDAYHVPAILAASYQRLGPGDSVKFVDPAARLVERCDRADRHGIVDPFLIVNIKPSTMVDDEDTPDIDGDLFLVLLDPGVAQNVTHHFEMEEFPTAVELENGRWNSSIFGCGPNCG